MRPVKIVWGSQTGNARNLAHVIGEAFGNELPVEVHDMGNLEPEELRHVNHLVVVTSTYGDGEPPDNASEWMSFLKFGEDLDLSHLRYAVIGLGDPYYPHFCQAGKDFDEYLRGRGARALLPRLDCDRYYEEQYPDWVRELKTLLLGELSD
jgi:sulfite reductase (NADPH) flavoprotein alpha-component